ncbi:MAG: hypothetical protein RI906_411 [Pseudomonadota bacterium]|jgi:drug/metabolite transporter (DMT)-like permease
MSVCLLGNEIKRALSPHLRLICDMVIEPWYWIAFTVTAAAAQTGRNALQRELTAVLGTAGATQVRFLYGLPFGLAFCALVLWVTGERLPALSINVWLWALVGGLGQIAGTALMLAAMREKSFVVSTALTKIEPVWVAMFGLVLLGDALSPGLVLAIATATAGVLVMSWPAKGVDWSLRPMLLGLSSGAGFGVAAIGFRAAIQAVPEASFVLAASVVVALGLSIQTTLLAGWMLVRERALLVAIARAWRPSLLAGLLGAFASQCWFLAFAVETAARVRTLALVEILFAHLVSRRLLSQNVSAREAMGLVLLIAGVVLVLNA